MSTARDSSTSVVPLTMGEAEQLIEAHQAGIWRYLRSLGCDASEADDITQETFLSILERPFNHYSPAATAAYLRKVAFNRFVSTRRRAGKVVLMEQLEEVDQTWARLASDDQGEAMLEALKGCLRHLSKRARWALEMRFRDRCSRMEIASTLDITEHGAKNLMQRAKKQLRDCIEGKLS